MTTDPKPPTHEELVIHLMTAQLKQSARLADALESVARSLAPEAPNYQRQLAYYSSFDWSSIGARIVSSDDDGPSHVEWGEYTWQRRSPQNKFGEAIWFSRPLGKDAEGNVKYVRLITFRQPSEVEPIPSKVSKAAETGKPTAPTTPAPASASPNPEPPKAAVTTHRIDSNGLLAQIKTKAKPSDVAALLPSIKPADHTTLYFTTAKHFGIDKQLAADIATEKHGDWAAALAGLDQHVF